MFDILYLFNFYSLILSQGGTLKFSVYIGEADFFGVKILNSHIFGGFSEKLVIF